MQVVEELQTLHKSCNPPCITRRCRTSRCTLVLPRQRHGVLVIDCDKCTSFPQGRSLGEGQPDFIVLYVAGESSRSRWLVVDMKARLQHAKAIAKQLQDGTKIVERDRRFQVRQSPQDLIGLALYKGRAHNEEIKALERQPLYFRGKPCRIIMRHCGYQLKDLV